VPAGVDDDDVLEGGQRVADRLQLAAIQRFGGDQQTDAAIARRARIGSGPNAAKSGQNTARALRVPSPAT
jgi:hypothetical protein